MVANRCAWRRSISDGWPVPRGVSMSLVRSSMPLSVLLGRRVRRSGTSPRRRGSAISGWRRSLVSLTVLVSVLAAVGCGASGPSTSDAEARLTQMLTDEVADRDPPVYIGNVSCVAQGDSRFECIAEVDAENAEPVNISGTLACDPETCLWRTG